MRRHRSKHATPSACERCVTGNVIGNATYCRECSQVIDRIILRSIDGDLNNIDLAEILDLSVNSVALRKSRALKRLRAQGINAAIMGI